MPPFRAELEAWGTAFGDLAFGPGDSVLVSDRFRTAFVAENLSGLDGFEEVEIVHVTRHHQLDGEPPTYFHARPQIGPAALDDAASEVAREGGAACHQCRLDGIRRAERVVLEPDTWSGEDLFIARGLPGTYLASERFERFSRVHGFHNAVLLPAEKYGFDLEPWTRDRG